MCQLVTAAASQLHYFKKVYLSSIIFGCFRFCTDPLLAVIHSKTTSYQSMKLQFTILQNKQIRKSQQKTPQSLC